MTQRILNCSHGPLAAMFAAVALLVFANKAFAAHVVEKVLHNFQGSPDGAGPVSGLVSDAAGNLYGTTKAGGNDSACLDCGIVFELSPPARQGGSWTERVLYSFHGGDTDGWDPEGDLTFDKLGNLYGTTRNGGHNSQGTVFELSPPATQGGAWTETVLFFFSADGSQGSQPLGRLTFDGVGNLYGSTYTGGNGPTCTNNAGACGTVFKLKPPAAQGGVWTESVLHTFGVGRVDGIYPESGVVFRKGVLYGTTFSGTVNFQYGTIFQLTMNNGIWNEKLLYRFDGSIGAAFPVGGLVFDSTGNLYGTASNGAGSGCSADCGIVLELSPPAIPNNPWQETTLFTFVYPFQGSNPFASLIQDKLGNLYGTTFAGGAHTIGAVFKLKPPAVSGGAWTEVIWHSFDNPPDGYYPYGKLILVNGKGLYGTTSRGGSQDAGTVFNLSIVP
jgi:uncharacterized repeat protein (TIGR03803 family)